MMHGTSPWDQRAVARFWRFVAERHEIFRRRVLLKQPPPWTDDPVLESVRFTNIYRELDRATRVLIRSLPVGVDFVPADALFNICKFRYFTLPVTYEALGGYQPAAQWDPESAVKILLARQRAGHRLFTGAFMSPSFGAPPGPGGKARLVVKRITWVKRHLPALTWAVFNAPRMEEAHRALLDVPGFGGFMAYECLIDATYTGRTLYGKDEWVYVGPGAFKGLQLLLTDPVPHRDAATLVAELRDTQAQGFGNAWVTLHGPRLDLENVEQALCEHLKYQRATAIDYAKRRFNPTKASTDYTVWGDIPDRFW